MIRSSLNEKQHLNFLYGTANINVTLVHLMGLDKCEQNQKAKDAVQWSLVGSLTHYEIRAEMFYSERSFSKIGQNHS